MSEPLRSVSILGYYGNQNAGDEAILAALLTGLQNKLPQTEFVVLSSDPEFTKAEYRVKAVPEVLPPTWTKHLVCALGRNRHSFKKAVATATSSEVLIVGGGGLIFDRPDGNKHLLEFLGKINFARRQGMKIALLGVGVGPLIHDSSKRVVVKTLSQADLIVVREDSSRELLVSIGLDHPRLHVAGDFGFLLEPSGQASVRELMKRLGLVTDKRPLAAICLRGTDAQKPTVTVAVEKLTRHLIADHSARIWFLPFQFSGGDDDRPGLAQLKERLADCEAVDFIDQPLSPTELKALISQVDLLVGQRFHSLVFAASHSKPFIGIAYHPKVSRLFEQLGRADLSVALDDLKPDSLVRRLDLIWPRKEEQIAGIKKFYAKQVAKSQQNFELFFSHFGISG